MTCSVMCSDPCSRPHCFQKPCSKVLPPRIGRTSIGAVNSEFTELHGLSLPVSLIYPSVLWKTFARSVRRVVGYLPRESVSSSVPYFSEYYILKAKWLLEQFNTSVEINLKECQFFLSHQFVSLFIGNIQSVTLSPRINCEM